MSFFSLRGSYQIAESAGDGMSSSDAFQNFLLDFVKRRRGGRQLALDVGAGSGLFSRKLLCLGLSTVAADFYPDHCQVPCRFVNLNTNFAATFAERFDVICLFEVLEHVENPRAVLRSCAELLNKDGVLFVSTPDVSGIYSRLRFVVTGEFAMFSEEQYRSIGHITPISYWQMRKMLDEVGFRILEEASYDGSSKIPRTLGDLLKMGTWLLRPLMRGHVGTQVMVFACTPGSAAPA